MDRFRIFVPSTHEVRGSADVYVWAPVRQSLDHELGQALCSVVSSAFGRLEDDLIEAEKRAIAASEMPGSLSVSIDRMMV